MSEIVLHRIACQDWGWGVVVSDGEDVCVDAVVRESFSTLPEEVADGVGLFRCSISD